MLKFHDFPGFSWPVRTLKKLEEKTIDSYSSYVPFFGFYTPQNVNSAATFVFKSRLVSLAWFWCYVDHTFPEMFISPLSEFEQHMYSSDPRPDTGSSMQLEIHRTVQQASESP